MKHLPSIFLLALCATTSACQSRTPSGPGSNPISPSERTVASNATIKLVPPPAATSPGAAASLNHLHKGMAYADFRHALTKAGWQPIVDQKCKAHVVGAAYADVCAQGSDSCKACDELPELSACSGDAVCVMHFQDAHTDRQLEVSTYGDISDRNVHGATSQLAVTGWTVSQPPLR